MESLLRQWGGASSSNINNGGGGGGFGVGTGSGYQFGESNSDFNYYFDNENNSSIVSGVSDSFSNLPLSFKLYDDNGGGVGRCDDANASECAVNKQ